MSLSPDNSRESGKNVWSNSETGIVPENSCSQTSGQSVSESEGDTSKNAMSKNGEPEQTPKKDKQPKKPRGYCFTPASSSHTHFYKKKKHVVPAVYERITRREYLGVEESVSGSSDTFGCEHPGGKVYTEAKLLERNLVKKLDPIQIPPEWHESCPPSLKWEMAEKLMFLMSSDLAVKQMDRTVDHLRQFAKTASNGFRVDVLDHVCVIMDFLVEHYRRYPALREGLDLMLQVLPKPILLTKASDVVTYLEPMQHYIGFLGYLLLRIEEDSHFATVSGGLIWQLSARRSGLPRAVCPRVLLTTAGHLTQTCVRMIAFATTERFPVYLQLALILAIDSEDNCLEMIKEGVIENIFCRFNPYFPCKSLPVYDIAVLNPNDDINVKVGSETTGSIWIKFEMEIVERHGLEHEIYNYLKSRLGDSTKQLSSVMSLLLVLLKTAKDYLKKKPKQRSMLPCPDEYALRCYSWAFRHECLRRDHHHERNTMLAITMLLLDIFREKLFPLSCTLMPDVLSLAVSTELPPRNDWTAKVHCNTSQIDVQFKKSLIQLSVYFLKCFPNNWFMLEHRLWFVGLMYLLDPDLSSLRAPWSSMLFAEIQKTALQALIISVPYLPYRIVQDTSLIRRLMWYIEWYSHIPYDISILYWCVRLLIASLYKRHTLDRKAAMKELFESHGLIMIIDLAKTLLTQKQPPVEKSQAIIGLCMRIFTSSLSPKRILACNMYPNIKWPTFLLPFGKTVLQMVLSYLTNHFIISDRLLIQMLNFIWEGIIWDPEFRTSFIKTGGVYQLLDLITLTDRSVQCLTLALLCDLTRTGKAVAQLVTWRANAAASAKHPNLVKRGATIASLLAAVAREDLVLNNVQLDEYGVIKDLKQGIMPMDMWKYMRSPEFYANRNQKTMICFAAGDLCGSRMSKAYALLQLLSEDLAHLIDVADEQYNLYKNVQLSLEDEVILVLVSHYLTFKLGESWQEIGFQNSTFLPGDEDVLAEFLEIKHGWSAEVQNLQMYTIKTRSNKDKAEEYSLYAFLRRVQLNTALDALRAVKCAARSADRDRMAHVLLHEAVRAYHRRSTVIRELASPVIKTYEPMLDEQNVTGQYLTVQSIQKIASVKPPNSSRLKI